MKADCNDQQLHVCALVTLDFCYISFEYHNNCLGEALDLIVELWLVHSCRQVFYTDVSAEDFEVFDYKLSSLPVKK